MLAQTIHPLRLKRFLKGVTQKTLANSAGVDQSQISLIETGQLLNLSEEKKGKLAQALGEDPKELFPEVSQ
jgi:transcriptional regulator with XRE-family HTH domain